MQLAISIIGAILAIFIIIILHEMGHFFVARWFGIKILRFSIGFGKALYKRVGKDGTEYVLAVIPLGGFVKMLGEADVKSVAPEEMHRAFGRKPLLVRIAVVLAGPLTNFILAIIVFWGAYLIGVQNLKPMVGKVMAHSFAAKAGMLSGDTIVRVGEERTHNWQQVIMALLESMGDAKQVDVWVKPKNSDQLIARPFNLAQWKIDKRDPEIFATLGFFPYLPPIKPVILQVMPDSPAARAQLQPKDVIVTFNGKPVTDWMQVVKTINRLPGKDVHFTVVRGQAIQSYTVQLGSQLRNEKNVGYLGIMVVPPEYPPEMLTTERYNVLTAWVPALMNTALLLKYNAIVLAKMVTTKLSVKTMGGPISIFQAAGQATEAGWAVYLNFIGFISLTVGFINLLPIPGLDGGHLLFQVIEGIIRRPVPEKIQQYGFTLGMMFVLLIIVHATINDILRILG